MSRPIKFDAIYQPTGDHFVPSEIDLINNAVSGYIDGNYGRCYFSLDGKYGDVILRQFTGLCDRNGKEIYERDLLQDDEGIGEVEWVQEHCAYMVFTRNPSTYHRLESDGILKHSEVIGNVWEHPHLLQEGDSKDA